MKQVGILVLANMLLISISFNKTILSQNFLSTKESDFLHPSVTLTPRGLDLRQDGYVLYPQVSLENISKGRITISFIPKINAREMREQFLLCYGVDNSGFSTELFLAMKWPLHMDGYLTFGIMAPIPYVWRGESFTPVIVSIPLSWKKGEEVTIIAEWEISLQTKITLIANSITNTTISSQPMSFTTFTKDGEKRVLILGQNDYHQVMSFQGWITRLTIEDLSKP